MWRTFFFMLKNVFSTNTTRIFFRLIWKSRSKRFGREVNRSNWRSLRRCQQSWVCQPSWVTCWRWDDAVRSHTLLSQTIVETTRCSSGPVRSGSQTEPEAAALCGLLLRETCAAVRKKKRAECLPVNVSLPLSCTRLYIDAHPRSDARSLRLGWVRTRDPFPLKPLASPTYLHSSRLF